MDHAAHLSSGMMAESQKFFRFAGVPQLLLGGLTIATSKDLAIFLIGLILMLFFLESLERISRVCFRKVPMPSRTPTDADAGLQLKRRRSDKVPLTSYAENENVPEEMSSCMETEEKNGNIPNECTETKCCSEKSERIIGTETKDGETTSLVDTHSCFLDAPEMRSEEQKRARVERMWKSLSLDVLTDRWEMLQTTSEEQEGSSRKITRSYRMLFHFLQTILSMGQMTMGYIVMFIVMTYNAWFLICIVGGAGLGYLIFSSDLEGVYANYAERYIQRKIKEEDARQKTCRPTDPCRKLSWKKKLIRDKLRDASF